MDDIGRYIWGTAGIILLVLIAMFFAAVGTGGGLFERAAI